MANYDEQTRLGPTGEEHPAHEGGEFSFNDKTYTWGSGAGTATHPTIPPGRYDIHDDLGPDTKGAKNWGRPDIAGKKFGQQGFEGGAMKVGPEPIYDKTIQRKDHDRTGVELHEAMSDKALSEGCIAIVGKDHYAALKADLKEAWARGDKTVVNYRPGQGVSIDRVSSHPDYSGEGSVHKGPIGSPQEDTKGHASQNPTRSLEPKSQASSPPQNEKQATNRSSEAPVARPVANIKQDRSARELAPPPELPRPRPPTPSSEIQSPFPRHEVAQHHDSPPIDTATYQKQGNVPRSANPANPYFNSHEFEYAVVTDHGAMDKTKQGRVTISPQSLAGTPPEQLPKLKMHTADNQTKHTWNSQHNFKNSNIVKVRKDQNSGEWELIGGNPGQIGGIA